LLPIFQDICILIDKKLVIMKTLRHIILAFLLFTGISVFAQEKTDTFKVYGNCGMCKKRVEKAASGLEGVVEAVWSTDSKKMVVKYNADKVSVSDIKKKIAAVGHDTDEFKASKDVYDKLPGCCLYDRMQ
jgi:copper chaperone CopZ